MNYYTSIFNSQYRITIYRKKPNQDLWIDWFIDVYRPFHHCMIFRAGKFLLVKETEVLRENRLPSILVNLKWNRKHPVRVVSYMHGYSSWPNCHSATDYSNIKETLNWFPYRPIKHDVCHSFKGTRHRILVALLNKTYILSATQCARDIYDISRVIKCKISWEWSSNPIWNWLGHLHTHCVMKYLKNYP